MRLGHFLFDFRPFRPPVAIQKTRKTLGKKSAHLSHAHSNSTAVTVGVGHSATQQHRQGAQHRLKQGMPQESFSTPGPYPAGSHGTPCIRPGHCGTPRDGIIQQPRDSTGCYLRDLTRRDSTALFVLDPVTAVLPGTGSSHVGTKPAKKKLRIAWRIFLASPGISKLCDRFTVRLLITLFLYPKMVSGNTTKQRRNIVEFEI